MSQTCLVSIRIDNPFLLQLIRNYGSSRNLDIAGPFEFDATDEDGHSLALLMDNVSASPAVWAGNTPDCLADVMQALLRALRRSHTMVDVIGLQCLLKEYEHEIDSSYREVQWRVCFRRTDADIDTDRLRFALGISGQAAEAVCAVTDTEEFTFTPASGYIYTHRCAALMKDDLQPVTE